jgi:hypothetical protein
MYKLLLLLLVPSNFAFSQQKVSKQNLWHLTVADDISLKGIDKATLSINKTHYITNANGVIIIDKTTINQGDSIIISCIGYKSRLMKPGLGNQYPDTIRLLISVTTLKEVAVHSTKSKGVILGDLKEKYNTHRTLQPEQEMVQFIPNDKKIKGTITEVEYVLNDELHGIEMPFKVSLYLKSNGSIFPGEELTKDSIIIYNPEKKRTVTVDISKYNIQFPKDGVIVTFETLSPAYYKKDLTWYQGRWELKMPGIDMDLKKKGDYPIDLQKKDRTGPYSMVISVADKWDPEEVKFHSYIFSEGINAAITIKVSPEL